MVTQTDRPRVQVPQWVGGVILLVITLCVGGGLWYLYGPQKRTMITIETEPGDEHDVHSGPGSGLNPVPRPAVVQDPGPTRVTLNLKDATPKEAIEQLARASKASISIDPNALQAVADRRVTISVRNEPFWAVMRQITRQTDLWPTTVPNQPSEMRMITVGERRLKYPSVQSGSFHITLDSVTRVSNIDPTDVRPVQHNLTASLMLQAEPTLPLLVISSWAQVESATDSVGMSMVMPPPTHMRANNPAPWMAPVTVNLRYPAKPGSRIARLKGHVVVTLATEEEMLRIENPLDVRDTIYTVAGHMIRFRQLHRSGSNMYYLQLNLDGSAARSPFFGNYDLVLKRIKLVDRNGKAFESGLGGWGGGNTQFLSYYFRGTSEHSEPAELTLAVPKDMRNIHVPFEFTDVLLP